MRVLGEVVASAANSWFSYLRGAVPRSPLDLPPLRFAEDRERFSRVLLGRQPAKFHRTGVVTREWPMARLRDFSEVATDTGPAPAVPTLVVPPRSGHTSCVVDLSAKESLLGTALAAGLSDLHCIEWLAASVAETDSGIEAHLRVLSEAVAALGGRVNIIGFSQGGWLAGVYAACHPDSVVTLTLAAAPIDSHRGRHVPQALLRRLTGKRFGTLATAALPWTHIPSGHVQLAGLQAAELPWTCKRVARLWGGIEDDAKVWAEAAYQDWLQQPQNVPADFYRWSIEHMFIRNELARGVLVVAGDRVNLAEIDCPLFLLAGRSDVIVPPEQVWALADLVSTPRREVVKISAECAHLGLVADAAVLRECWLPLLRDVLLVSSARAGVARV